MKNLKWVGIVVALALPLPLTYSQTPEGPVAGGPDQAQAAPPVSLSPGAAEVVRLATSGVGDDVVLAYIQNSQAQFNLTADAVVYLKDLGLSPQVTTAMLNHDSALQRQPQQYAPAAPAQPAPPPVAPAAQPPAVAPPPAAAPAPTYVTGAPADVSYFYGSLAPYGTWVSLDGYGWCWQPRTVVISPAWRPYCDGGHWVYTDAGWFWQSDYTWGWAPFHYGRWYQHPRCGWVWMPDRVWGPAWVTWRTSSDCCGWAPLPPHADFDIHFGWRYNGVTVGAGFDFGLGVGAFAFVSFGDFCSHDLGHHCLPPARVTTVYRQTTVVNNYVVVNNAVVHRGIPVDRVTAASRVPVPRATVRDWSVNSARTPSRTTAVVYRHPLEAPARPVRMEAQKIDTAHPVIHQTAIAPATKGRTSNFSQGAPASTTAQGRSIPEAPRSSPRSSGTRSASSPYSHPAPKANEPAPTTLPTVAPVRAPDNWKQGIRSAPGYRSDAGLPALNDSRGASPSSLAPAPKAANSHFYAPKSARQAAEIRSLPKSDQH